MRALERSLGIIVITCAKDLYTVEAQRNIHRVDVVMFQIIGAQDVNLPAIELPFSPKPGWPHLKREAIADVMFESCLGSKFPSKNERPTTRTLVLGKK